MKNVVLLALAASTLAVAAPAAAEVYTFTRDGIDFTAQETLRPDGIRLIEGTDSTGASFSFRVHGKYVRGTYRGEPVYFVAQALPKARQDRGALIAAR